MKASINVFDIKQVEDKIKEALQEEHNSLLEDVEYLQRCLDAEVQYKNRYPLWRTANNLNLNILTVSDKSSAKQPSIQDLKEFGAKLEVIQDHHIMIWLL